MDLTPGRALLHYRLVDKIGAGGMGDVWKATDTTLGREVALKFLPGSFAEDPERLSRFEREAKVLASLNHSNIAGIYGLHEHEGMRFLAMELVPGEDLAQKFKGDPIPLAEALDIARQIAEALEAAHEQGIIHRDLKPANIQLTPDGKVKVLDFGLAKALETATTSAPGRDPSMSPTVTSLGTVVGVILGTAAYMSPEQARGKPVDKRADIWAFGCVLFELLTGTRPFDGETVSDTLAAVLARDADWTALPAGTPSKVRDLVQRCLEKDPKRRLRDIGDARLELEEALASRTASGRVRVAAEPAPQASPRSRSRSLAVVAIVCALVGAALGGWVMSRGSSAGTGGRVVRLDLDLPAHVKFTEFGISPDGISIAAAGSPRVAPGATAPPPRIYVRRLDTATMNVLAGLEDTGGITFSVDGRSMITTVPVTQGSPQRNLVRVPVDGSAPPFALTAWNPEWTTGGVMNDGDGVVLDGGTDLVRIPAKGGAPLPPVKVDLAGEKGTITIAHRALPGDKGILLQAIAYGAKGWYFRVGVLDLKTARITYLFDDGGNPVYSPTGQIVFTRGDTLLAVGFDPDTMKITGSPVPLASGLQTEYSFQPALFDLSNDGTLVYVPGGRTAEARRLGLVDANGAVTPVIDEGHAYQWASASSADGRRFVATITNGQAIDELWVGEFGQSGLRRLVAIPDADVFTPILSRDGRQVAFGRRGQNAEDGTYVMTIDDGSAPRRIAPLPAGGRDIRLSSWTPDGAAIVGSRQGADQKGDLVYIAVPATGDGLEEPRSFLSGPGDENNPKVSPDGRWLAYASDESGRSEIYIAAFGPGGSVHGTHRVTRAGGSTPHWSADGHQLRYLDEGNRVMSLPIVTTPGLSVGSPTAVYDATQLHVLPWDLLPDGRQFVTIRGAEESDEIRRLAVVLNFSRELTEKMKAAR